MRRKPKKRKGIDRKVGPKIVSSAESLAAKGFLRPQKEYTPPEDVKSKLEAIFHSVLGTKEGQTRLDNLSLRFQVLNTCYKEFQHGIPNSLLHTIETTSDVHNFYTTPLSTITPYENIKNMDVPPNLHVQYEYHRFHPETDTKFGGITAFPRSSTIVSGLKYKEKYKGHQQRESWPFTT
uniref:Large ribosomal subunit protein mL50 n=1 Tax=Photinus pyralis TaxID=7054 RepID=A0A1Y1MDP8_PHOPY